MHSTLAVMILSCNLEAFRTHSPENNAKPSSTLHSCANITPPPEVRAVINGAVSTTYLREVSFQIGLISFKGPNIASTYELENS